jgi:hypothetical protein
MEITLDSIIGILSLLFGGGALGGIFADSHLIISCSFHSELSQTPCSILNMQLAFLKTQAAFLHLQAAFVKTQAAF